MYRLDFTSLGHRPSTAQIVSAWKKAKCPAFFSVEYGETFAEFELYPHFSEDPRWADSGNGCSGVDRNAVVDALVKETNRCRARFADLCR
jgi:hypothetical protein